MRRGSLPARESPRALRGGSIGFLVLAALSPLIAARARAGDLPPDPDLAAKQMRRVGPFRLQPILALKDVGYDDNIRFDAQTPASDTTATAGAGLDALLLTGDRGGVRMSGEADYVAFGRNTDLNHWNGDGRARGILVLKSLVLSLEDRFQSVRERPSTEIDQRIRRENNAVTAAMHTYGDHRLGLRALLRHERIDYASGEAGLEEIGRDLNRDENTLAVIGELRVLPKTLFTLEGNVQRIDFADATDGRDGRFRSVLPGLRFDPSASVQGEFKIGVTRFEAPDRPGSDFHGAVGSGHLSTRLGRAARLKGTFDRNLGFSVIENNLYYVSTAWSAAYEQFFSRRVSGELLYGSGLNHYPEPVTFSGPTPVQGIRDDRLTTYQVAVRYRINAQMSLAAVGQRIVRDSTDDAFDRERDFYALGTTYTF